MQTIKRLNFQTGIIIHELEYTTLSPELHQPIILLKDISSEIYTFLKNTVLILDVEEGTIHDGMGHYMGDVSSACYKTYHGDTPYGYICTQGYLS